jgi:predicted nucleic acid-binding protein
VKARVYVETSVISYLTARPSRDLLSAAHQQVTLDWWDGRRQDFELFTSELVVAEARMGDSNAAQRRLGILRDIPLLPITEQARSLAVAIVRQGFLPAAALPDALHIATAAVHEMDYLLTWNCTHIANAEILPRIAPLCEEHGRTLPYICTPEELLGAPNVQ